MKKINHILLMASLTGMLSLPLQSCEKTEIEVMTPPCSMITNEDHPHAASYEFMIDEFLAAGLPGFGLTVHSPEGWWTGTGGKADLGNNLKLEPCHAFRIGSASKVFTAVLVMMLHEDGLIDLDEKINVYVPRHITDNIPNGNKATIRQLLNHSSGIPEHLNAESYTDIINLSQSRIPAEAALQYIYGKKPLCAPGESQNYSNSNYLLLALAIRNASHASSAYEVLKERIIEPLGLDNTHPGTEIPSNMSLGYYEYYGLMKELTELDNAAVGGQDRLDGGIISNSWDMALFLEALMTGQLVQPETLEMMLDTSPLEIEGFDHITGYGLGLMKIETEYGTAYGHYGSVHCFHSAFFYFPDLGTTVAYNLNGGSADLQEMAYSPEAIEMIFE